MRKTILFLVLLAVILLATSARGAMTYSASDILKNAQNVTMNNRYMNPLYLWANEVEGYIEGMTLEGGSTITFGNGGTFDNATDTKFEWNENSDELIWTFDSNSVTVSSGDVTLFDFGTVVLGFDQFKVNATTYTFPTSDGSDGQVIKTNGSGTLSWVNNAGGITDLDTAYNGGGTIDVDTDPLTFTVSDNDDNGVVKLVQNDGTNDPNALALIMGTNNTGIALVIDSQAGGTDISADNWSITEAGALTAVSGDFTGAAGLTLQNDGTILNDVDNEIQFKDGAEDVSFGFGTANTLTMTTDSDVDTIAWGDLDAWTGLNTVAFDATASTVTLAADGDTDDLTIQVTGTHNSSLLLTSAGTGTDAIRINASDGAIDLDAADGFAIDVAGTTGEDFIVTNSGGSIKLQATEGVEDAIVITASTAAGGIDITSQADIDITTTGADGEDITITNSGGSVNITATQDDADVIVIATTGGGGGSESINIQNDQGTAADAVDIDATAGGVSIGSNNTTSAWTHTANGAEDDLTISVAGNQDASLILTSAGNGTDALQITTTANSGDIVINSNDKIDMDSAGTFALNAAGDTLLIQVDSDGANDDLSIVVDGDDDSSIILDSDGTATDAIKINASNAAGGLDVDAGTNGIAITATGGAIAVNSTKDSASAIALTTNAGTSETIVVTNTQGNTAGAIDLQASAGGITLNGVSGGVVFTAGQTRKVLIPVEDVELDGANAPTLGQNGTNGQFVVPSLEFDADGGATGDDIVFIHWVVPDGYKVDSARLNVYWSFDTAEDAADECVFDCAVNAVAEGETLDAAGTDIDAVTTVVADASADNGKLFVDQLNIEAEDIAVDDFVTIMFWVDESASAMAASGTCDVHYFEIEYESTE